MCVVSCWTFANFRLERRHSWNFWSYEDFQSLQLLIVLWKFCPCLLSKLQDSILNIRVLYHTNTWCYMSFDGRLFIQSQVFNPNSLILQNNPPSCSKSHSHECHHRADGGWTAGKHHPFAQGPFWGGILAHTVRVILWKGDTCFFMRSTENNNCDSIICVCFSSWKIIVLILDTWSRIQDIESKAATIQHLQSALKAKNQTIDILLESQTSWSIVGSISCFVLWKNLSRPNSGGYSTLKHLGHAFYQIHIHFPHGEGMDTSSQNRWRCMVRLGPNRGVMERILELTSKRRWRKNWSHIPPISGSSENFLNSKLRWV